MIIVRLQGGLGNQLFQYAAGRALAVKHKVGLVLDLAGLSRSNSKITERHFELNRFNVNAGILEKGPRNLLLKLPNFLWQKTSFGTWTRFFETSFDFNPNFFRLPNDSYLIGYWQSYRYFDLIADEILDNFTPKEKLSAKSETIKKLILQSNSIGVHIRRGDYISLNEAKDYHGALPVEYYKSSIAKVAQFLDSPSFFIFSDDIAWCEQNISINNATVTYVSHNLSQDSWQDLVLLSFCRHQIIANSSFSWWGAWIADQRYGSDRHVVAPKKWFANESNGASDRFPAHWELI